MQRFIKRPVEALAEQWVPVRGDEHKRKPEMPYPPVHHSVSRQTKKGWQVKTIHGQWTDITPWDWLILEPDELHVYPCKPDTFEKTYLPVRPSQFPRWPGNHEPA